MLKGACEVQESGEEAKKKKQKTKNKMVLRGVDGLFGCHLRESIKPQYSLSKNTDGVAGAKACFLFSLAVMRSHTSA